jgi:hypothetical protein
MISFKKFLMVVIGIMSSVTLLAQESGNTDYYRQIPVYPDSYTATNVAARLIDGLGFRYYWATNGLREEDLKFRPNEKARTSMETLQHIYGLTLTMTNAVKKVPNKRTEDPSKMSFGELRAKTLENIRIASEKLKASTDGDMTGMIIFSDNPEKGVPFWNLLNGPIADALWHIGQVVSFRRSSGNPFDGRANVFTGKYSE